MPRQDQRLLELLRDTGGCTRAELTDIMPALIDSTLEYMQAEGSIRFEDPCWRLTDAGLTETLGRPPRY